MHVLFARYVTCYGYKCIAKFILCLVKPIQAACKSIYLRIASHQCPRDSKANAFARASYDGYLSIQVHACLTACKRHSIPLIGGTVLSRFRYHKDINRFEAAGFRPSCVRIFLQADARATRNTMSTMGAGLFGRFLIQLCREPRRPR